LPAGTRQQGYSAGRPRTTCQMICQVEQPGVVGYRESLRLQHERVLARKAGTVADTLILLEHPPVYTLGRNANRQNILFSPERLRHLGAEVFETDRGGDVTYHGPGQMVGYPILDLTRHRRDLSWYMRSLEEVFIRVAGEFGIQAGRLDGARGVWVGNDKLVAMGVHVSRWVTSQGSDFAPKTPGQACFSGGCHRTRYPPFWLGVWNGDAAGRTTSRRIKSAGESGFSVKCKVVQLARYGSSAARQGQKANFGP